MDGLERMIDAILRQAEETAGESRAAAEAQRADLLAQAQQEEQAAAGQARDACKREMERIKARAAAADAQQAKQKLLETRARVIDEVLEEARVQMETLPDAQYFDLLLKLIEKYAQPGAGELILSAKDKARMPDAFITRCNNQMTGRTITLADGCAEISGGFLIRYGMIEENCAFDSLFEANRERLVDRVNACLTAGA